MADEIKLPEVDLTLLKPGREVWLKAVFCAPSATTGNNHFLFSFAVPGGVIREWVHGSNIVRILPPPETAEEKIARLEAEVERLKQEGAELYGRLLRSSVRLDRDYAPVKVVSSDGSLPGARSAPRCPKCNAAITYLDDFSCPDGECPGVLVVR